MAKAKTIKVHPDFIHSETLNIEANPDATGVYAPEVTSVLHEMAGIQTGNLFKQEVKRPNVKVETDDAAAVFYVDGLPCIAAADGALGSHSAPPQYICKTFMAEKLPGLVAALKAGGDPDGVMKGFLKEVNTQGKLLSTAYQYTGGAQFTFSCAVSYEVDGVIHVAAIGSGDVLIAIKREHAGYETLRAAEYVLPRETVVQIAQSAAKKLPDAPPKQFLPAMAHGESTEAILQGATVARAVLKPGDTLLALTDGATNFLPNTFASGEFTAEAGKGFLRVSLAAAANEISVEGISAACITARDAFIQSTGQGWGKAGDDYVVAHAVVPGLQTRNAILKSSKKVKLKEEGSTASAGFFRRKQKTASTPGPTTPLNPTGDAPYKNRSFNPLSCCRRSNA